MTTLISRIQVFFRLFFSALRGEEKEFTKGSINKAIFLLSVPMMAEMVMESLFAVVDVFFVSRISVNAVATVGLTESMLMIIYSIAVGMSMAVTAIVARRVGEKNPVKASETAFQGILISASFGILIGSIGFWFAEDLLRRMGGSEELISQGVNYTRVMFAGNVSILLLFVLNAIFRGAGDASIAMRSLWIANGLNILLDPVLIFGLGPIPAMGIAGAAIATTIGRSVGVLYQVYFLINGKAIIKLVGQTIRLQWETIKEIFQLSVGGVGQFLVETASWIFLVRVMSLFGAEALAGYTIAFRVIVFTILPSWGMANAAATLVGQNLGAGQPQRAEDSVWIAARVNMIFLGTISIIFFVFADTIISLFSTEATVVDIGSDALQIICFGYLFFAYGMVISQAFNGAGDTKTPLYINIFVFWILQIPLAYTLSVYFDWQANGVFFSIAFCHSLHALICVFWFRKGKWKLVQV